VVFCQGHWWGYESHSAIVLVVTVFVRLDCILALSDICCTFFCRYSKKKKLGVVWILAHYLTKLKRKIKKRDLLFFLCVWNSNTYSIVKIIKIRKDVYEICDVFDCLEKKKNISSFLHQGY
jgi:hypothetical protein